MKFFLKLNLASVLVFSFFLTLISIGLVAEMFEAQTPEVNFAQIYSNPIPIEDFRNIKKIQLTNKNGTFVFENTHAEGVLDGPWQMLSPQPLRAKSEVFKKIFSSFNSVRVRNFHRLEPLNLKSFSLDNPTLVIGFENEQKTVEVKMGLINPIDNSAYITVTGQDQIYQIDPLDISLESYDLPQLAESKVLALNLESLASMELYEQNNLIVKLLKKDNNWLDQNGTILSENKVKSFMEKIEAIRSSSVLENLNSDQKSFLNEILSTSVYSLKIISTMGARNYFFGELKRNVLNPGLPKEAAGSFVMSSEDRDSFVLIQNDELNFFSKGIKNLK